MRVSILMCAVSLAVAGTARQAFGTVEECFRDIDMEYDNGLVIRYLDLGCQPANVCAPLSDDCEEVVLVGPKYYCACGGSAGTEKACNPHIQGEVVSCNVNGCVNACNQTAPPPIGSGTQAYYCTCP